tara:strand:- start:199 stop:432 length:234 start_codon:yes stop_codon:yes gene_type:complete
MFIQIAPKVRVYVTEKQMDFIQSHSDHTFRNSELLPEQIEIAKLLADKAVFVRKKLDNDVQYALNRRIRFLRHGYKK